MVSGAGSGRVTSIPVGIDCGADCTEDYAPSTVVTLSAAPDAGSIFSAWSGACTDSTPTCQVTMSAAKTVTATFAPNPAVDFFTVEPCRALDSRQAAGPFGGTPLAAQQERLLTVGGVCGIPPAARAVSLNITATEATAVGHIRLYPGGAVRPGVSTLNFAAGQTRANNAIVQLGALGDLALFSGQATGSVHVVVDVNGYFE